MRISDWIRRVLFRSAVAVHALGAQDVLTGVEERNALAQRDQAEADLLHAYTLGKRGAARRLELDHVEQGLVVVRGGVVDRFLRVGGIPDRKSTRLNSSH